MTEYRNVKLTHREEEVCRLTLQGLTAKEVAQRTLSSPRTIDAHVNNVRLKLGASNRSHMAAHLLVRGLITMGARDL